MTKKAVIFDVDGTIANNEHRVHHLKETPKNWDAFFSKQSDDPPYLPMIAVAQAMSNAGHSIIICTARHNKHAEETILWMEKHNMPWDEFYSRDEGDRTNDDIMKRELLQRMRKHGHDPFLVFDDRDRLVKMWRKEGLMCCQPNYGDF